MTGTVSQEVFTVIHGLLTLQNFTRVLDGRRKRLTVIKTPSISRGVSNKDGRRNGVEHYGP